MMQIIGLSIGGIAGTLSRYFLSASMNNLFFAGFPFGTMTVNTLGCFLIGVFIVIIEEKMMIPADMKILLVVGFCGSFTTFSTFILEAAHLIRGGDSMRALYYVGGSLLLGFIALWIGVKFTRIF